MIRCNTTTLKFTNRAKLDLLSTFVDDYTNMVNKFINIIWNTNKLSSKSFIDNTTCKTISTNREYDSRIRQCAAKQASGIVRAVTAKRRRQLYKLAELQKEGKSTRYLQRKIDLKPLKKPCIKNLNVELNSRFVDFQFQPTNKLFNIFVRIKQIGNKQQIVFPVKFNKVIRKFLKLGKLKSSIRISKKQITFFFDLPEAPKKGNVIVGADQGLTTCLTLSDGQVTKKNKHNHDLTSITKILTRRVKNSKGFKRTQTHRKNYVNWSLNQLNFKNIKQVKFEKICNLRKGKKTSRYLSHWCYTLIKDKLVSLSEDKGFVFTEQDNKYRSQRCSACGWTHKLNRKGKTFKCKRCRFLTDSDLNAASNHEVELVEIPRQVWLQKLNRSSGFYWNEDSVIVGNESIVRCVQKTN